MKVTGIIAEYNPFHNGHKYHIEKAREITDADYCIVIMSGNFTQRGEPALMDKYLRSKMALECGADLVLELPVCYACASAPYFATGAVALLDKLGVTDYVVFGSESGNISAIQEIAQILTDEPALYTSSLKNHLKSGHSYPAAQNLALTDCFGQQKTLDTGLLSSPNNLLGVEYCKALFARKSFIKPITITRQGSGYSDTVLHQANSSALAIRTALCAASESGLQSALESIRTQVPDYAFSLMQEHYKKLFPIFPDTLSAPLHYKLLLEAETGFISYLDINEELSERICNHLPDYQNFSSFCMLLKTKELTYTRISRSLLHILLDIRKADIELYRANDWISYGRILGFRKDSTPLLSAIKANASVPLIPKLADACKYLDESAMTQLKKDIQAAHIYNSFVQHTYGTKLPVEMQRQILRS